MTTARMLAAPMITGRASLPLAAAPRRLNAPEQPRTSRATTVFYPNLRYFNARSTALAS